METNEPAPHGGRACLHCGEAIPATRRSIARYCSSYCKYTAFRASLDPEELAQRRASEFQRRMVKDPERVRSGARTAQKAYTLRDVRRRMLAGAKMRAKQQGVPFSITADDIVIPDVCPVLGIELVLGQERASNSSPSLDKIIPALGYVPGNCLVVSNRANTLKNNATIQELQALASYYTNLVSSGGWLVPPAR